MGNPDAAFLNMNPRPRPPLFSREREAIRALGPQATEAQLAELRLMFKVARDAQHLGWQARLRREMNQWTEEVLK